MTKQLTLRILAWTIDFGIILLYAILLFVISNQFFNDKQEEYNPYLGQLRFFTFDIAHNPLFVFYRRKQLESNYRKKSS